MDQFFSDVLGQTGTAVVIGLMVFGVVFRYSRDIFDWIERSTNNNREYIVSRFKLLFIEVDPVKITYFLLGLSFGLAFLVLIAFSLAGQFWVGIILGIIFFFVGWKLPRPFVNWLLHRRIKAYASQMVDGLQLLANGLRAGQSLPQALAMVVDELPPPISQEFNHILQQNRIGVPLEECLDELVIRIPTEDNQMFVSSVNILHETGGNLPETFSGIVNIIRERMRLQDKIETFVASNKTQGLTIFLMPYAILAIYGTSDPEAIKTMFTSVLGWLLFLLAVGLDLAGGYFIWKITQIKA